ncbi:protoporphyrinogen/coproporphyrinogen oxidase [Mycobacteroides abscessus]|uniref:protoporphyrinogen/coproporphyrinogen oxidase n=1 Tax=Mycobacteroides abscessus TaxID=36809 RepID=UPI0005DEA67A|nr:NAD(P)/FAD-dependent oxidoreductase [Mycobacteroides abscessus]CPS43673.1 protoporphyrinogen oxidase [Mycobacteroides abscessus]CPS45504.1 protoporphyrinogen oxidase [Mycobacteroides abscessus]CPS54556.1 protoporphyrinogen oxidase [Mycobacteroides abscessus]CPT37281.1 protoporphyrinogen oxidase [Mycobacteroides abscessus]CPT64359.1 protoporphyrinogen oxidase [Mycobacteroides abscessus]
MADFDRRTKASAAGDGVNTVDREPVFIVGAGPSGLTAAYRLHEQGIPAIVLEKRDRTGGMIHTHREQGYLMEEGATILPSAYKPVVKLANEVGSGPDLIPAGSVIGFARDDVIHNLRSDHLFADVLKTPLVSPKSKALMARFGIDATRASKMLNYEDLSRASAFDTMTPREYCSLHLGLSGEVYDYVINSTVRGVLGVRGDAISILELFFMLYNILGSKLFAFRQGYSTYIDKLSAGLDVRLSANVNEIKKTSDGVTVNWTDADGVTHTDNGSAVIVSVRGDNVPSLVPGHFDSYCENFLRSLRYTKCVVMNTGVTRKPKGIVASVINVPEPVDPDIMGFTCEHNKAPGRAPEGHGLMAILTMTEFAEKIIDEDDDTIRHKILSRMEKVIPGLSDTVDYTRVSRWNEVIVYSRPGLYKELGQFQARQAAANSRIHLAGVFRSSSNMCTATVAGENAASKVAEQLRTAGRSFVAV